MAACYVLEKELSDDIWPLRMIRPLRPTIDRIFKETPDDMAREQLNHLQEQTAATQRERGEVVAIARSYGEFEQLRAAGKIAVVHGMEGAHHLAHRIENLEDFFERGVCQLIVPHLYPNEAGSCVDAFPDDIPLKKLGCMQPQCDFESGWTDFGRQVIERMLELGMIVDLTHGTPKLRQEAYELWRNQPHKRPLLMSHVGVSALQPHPMNPTPEDIRAIAETGGAVGIIAMTHWLHAPKKPRIADVLYDTVDHLIEHGGEDVVAFGSDFDGFTGPPRDWASPADYVNVRTLLQARYSDTQVEKFCWGNAARVLRDGWGKH